MENFKLTKRLICSVVSASMIFASAGVVSAMGNNSTGSDTSAVLAEATATPAPTEEPAATDTPASTDEPEATASATRRSSRSFPCGLTLRCTPLQTRTNTRLCSEQVPACLK